jgi:hypothetical protein
LRKLIGPKSENKKARPKLTDRALTFYASKVTFSLFPLPAANETQTAQVGTIVMGSGTTVVVIFGLRINTKITGFFWRGGAVFNCKQFQHYI